MEVSCLPSLDGRGLRAHGNLAPHYFPMQPLLRIDRKQFEDLDNFLNACLVEAHPRLRLDRWHLAIRCSNAR